MDSNILIIDDNDAFREALSDLFESYGFKVTQAFSPMTALTLIENTHFDCIIVDILMPKMNGIEFTKVVLKSDKPTAIAIVSGYTDKSNFTEVDHSPYFVGFFPKPFDESKLITAVKNKINNERSKEFAI